MSAPIQYRWLNVYLVGVDKDAPPMRFEECTAVVPETRLLVVISGKHHLVFNADAWVSVEGMPIEP